jgi:hypothetical protein
MAIGVERAEELRTGETGMLSLSLPAEGARANCMFWAGACIESIFTNESAGDEDDLS